MQRVSIDRAGLGSYNEITCLESMESGKPEKISRLGFPVLLSCETWIVGVMIYVRVA